MVLISQQHTNFQEILEFIIKANGEMVNNAEKVLPEESMEHIFNAIFWTVKQKDMDSIFILMDLIMQVNLKMEFSTEEENFSTNLIKWHTKENGKMENLTDKANKSSLESDNIKVNSSTD